MALPVYENEAEFRVTFVAPLLTKLGFIVVTHSHGQDEQGKDFFFADYDRFDHIRFYAAQIKLGNIGAGTIELDGLLNQVRRAFRVRIRNRKEAEERRVSAVYVITNGTISIRAREYISEYCRSEPFGENVFFLDGEAIEQLDQKSQIRSDQDYRRSLLALLLEAQSNVNACNAIANDFKSENEPKLLPIRCRLTAMETFLSAPLPASILDYKVVDEAWITIDELNRICEMWSSGVVAGRGIGDNFRRSCLSAVGKAMTAIIEVIVGSSTALSILDERHRAQIQVFNSDN